MQEAVAPLDAGVVPLQVQLGRGREQREQTGRVRAVALDEIVRRDDVPKRLRHLAAVLGDHALREQVLERLVYRRHTEVVHDLRDEPRVQQMQDGVLDAAHVLVDGHPVAGRRTAEGALGEARGGEAEEIPRRIHERVHRVRLATRRFTRGRRDAVREPFVARQGVAALARELHIARVRDRQVVLRHEGDAAVVLVYHRDRHAPVPLPTDEPIA